MTTTDRESPSGSIFDPEQLGYDVRSLWPWITGLTGANLSGNSGPTPSTSPADPSQSGIALEGMAGSSSGVEPRTAEARPETADDQSESSLAITPAPPLNDQLPDDQLPDDQFDDPTRSMPGAWQEDDETAPSGDALKDLQERIRRDNSRPVDTEKAAQAINLVRRYGKGHRDEHRGRSNADLMSKVTDEVVTAWWEAQGANEQWVKDFKAGARNAGLINPWGTFLTNALNYIVAPAITAATGNPWAGFGAGVGFAIASPGLNATFQSGVVELCEQIRERTGPSVVPDKKQIHDKHWPSDLAEKVKGTAQTFTDRGERLVDTATSLITNHDPTWSDIKHLTADQIADVLQHGDDQQRTQIEGVLGAFRDSETRMEQLQRDLFMTEASWERQSKGNKWQMIPRSARSPASTLVGLGRGMEELAADTSVRMDNAVSRIATLSAGASVGVQAGLTVLIFGGNMVAAAADITNQHEYNNIANLMYGDCFTESGNTSIASGQPVTSEDIDPDKLRKFIMTPDQARVKRLAAIVDSKIVQMEKEIEGIRTRAELPQPRAAEEGSALPADVAADIDAKQAAVEILKAEKALIKDNKLEELGPDSFSAGLLKGNLDGFFSSFMTEGVKAKYRKEGEFTSQLAQRIAQTFHLVIAGSGAAALVGKLGGAILGGASRASAGQILGLSAAGLVMGGIGAYYQSSAVNIKNNRRDNTGGEDEVGFGTQVLRGVLGAPLVWQAAKQMQAANEQVVAALEKMQTADDLARKLEDALAQVMPSIA